MRLQRQGFLNKRVCCYIVICSNIKMVTSIDMAKRYKLTDRNTDLTGSDINTLSLIQQIFDILLQISTTT